MMGLGKMKEQAGLTEPHSEFPKEFTNRSPLRLGKLIARQNPAELGKARGGKGCAI